MEKDEGHSQTSTTGQGMHMDMEEGEISSSDNEESGCPPLTNGPASIEIPGDDDYVIIDRPKPAFPTASANSAVSQSKDVSALPVPLPNPLEFSSSIIRQKGRKGYFKEVGVSDLLGFSDDDSPQSDSSDSGDDGISSKRSRMGAQPSTSYGSERFSQSNTSSMPFGDFKASSSGNSAFLQATEAFRKEAAKFQQQRKPNLIWSNIIQEEQISNIFDQVKVAEPGFRDIEVTRGPETYHYQRASRTPRPRRPSDSSDISSGGLSDNALYYLRDGEVHYCEDNEEEESELAASSSEDMLPKSFTSTSVSKSSEARKATKRKRDRQKYKRKIINQLKKMKTPELAKYMCSKLTEEKVQLIGRAIEILGKENCILTFLKTLKIEKRGGIMVKNHQRRRTPGGVFLYLIRGDRRFEKGLIDLVFRDERVSHDKFRKKKLTANRLRRKIKLEAAKSAIENASGEEDEESNKMIVPDQDVTDSKGEPQTSNTGDGLLDAT